MPTTLNSEMEVMEADRVRRDTSAQAPGRIEEQMERNIAYYAAQPDHVIARRIEELEAECSLDRCLQANVASTGFLGAILGLTVNKKWALLTAGAFGFLLFHGLRGGDSPNPLLRRLGLRTRREIDRELYALRVARGDFKEMPVKPHPDSAVPVKEILQAVSA